MVGTSTSGIDPDPTAKSTIRSIDSRISWIDARLIITERMTIEIGSSFVRPESDRNAAHVNVLIRIWLYPTITCKPNCSRYEQLMSEVLEWLDKNRSMSHTN